MQIKRIIERKQRLDIYPGRPEELFTYRAAKLFNAHMQLIHADKLSHKREPVRVQTR
ncbi:hypothetical protein SDC9_207314 [bioreactor metagenome]|uniref:Uncharacterized protein n=1 Tax=bioreactor metagenome TaxID=1076179 RepID=A0A645JIY8_9ZZZZ